MKTPGWSRRCAIAIACLSIGLLACKGTEECRDERGRPLSELSARLDAVLAVCSTLRSRPGPPLARDERTRFAAATRKWASGGGVDGFLATRLALASSLDAFLDARGTTEHASLSLTNLAETYENQLNALCGDIERAALGQSAKAANGAAGPRGR